jgi:hypothetical protein
MTRKLAIVFAVLALTYIANATADTNSPASVFAVTPGKLFTNGTDTAFTSLTGGCYFNGGFDNTTNYVWCQTASASSTVPYTYERRAINASSPATTNSTADTKLASSHYAETNGMTTCSGAGYFGLATGYGTGTYPNYKPDVYFSYAAVNASSFTKVTLTSNSDSNMYVAAKACFYDNGIFYIIYTSYNYCQSGSESGCSAANLTQNAVYIQGVNVTSGAVYYNSTGGVKLWSPTSQTMSTLGFSGFVGNNQTGYATQGLLLYTDSSASSTTVGSKYNMLPITLSTGAAGSVQTLATGAQSTTSVSSTYVSTSTSTSLSSTSTGTSTTSTATASASTGTTTSITTDTAVVSTTSSATDTASVTFTTTTTGTSTITLYSTSYSTFTVTLYSTSTSSSYVTATNTGSVTSSVTTTYGMSAFGSLSTYGVVLTQTIQTYVPLITLTSSYTYSNSIYFNGSSTASTTANLTNPSGYYLGGVAGFATTDGGFCLLEYFPSTTSGSAAAIYKDTYYYNGTQTTTSVSLGTYQSTPGMFADATGSIWLGYTVNDDANSSYPLVSAYAGEVLYQNLSASTLSSIFATLAIMIAALFAF